MKIRIYPKTFHGNIDKIFAKNFKLCMLKEKQGDGDLGATPCIAQ